MATELGHVVMDSRFGQFSRISTAHLDLDNMISDPYGE